MNKNVKIIIVIMLFIFFGWIVYYFFFAKKEELQIYKEYIVEKGELQTSILATGTIQPENRLAIKPPIAGRADKVLVKEGMYVNKGHILAWLSSTERAALLDAAKSKGEEELKVWEALYKPTPVLAPIAGTIISKNIETGQSFTSSDSIFVLSNRLTIKAQVDETDISKIKVNQSVDIELDAYPDQIVEGQVSLIAFDSKAINNVTTYIVDVVPKSVPDFMRSGMTVNVTFYLEKKKDILLIPVEAINSDLNKQSILIKDPNNPKKNISVVVKLGLSDGKFYELISGIKENEVLLIKDYKLKKPEDIKINPLSPRRMQKTGKK